MSTLQYHPCNEGSDHIPWGKEVQIISYEPTAHAVALAFSLRGGNVGNGIKTELPV